MWLLLSFGSAVLLGGYEISRKAAVEKNAVLPVLFTASLSGFLSLCVLLLVGPSLLSAFGGAVEESAFTLPDASVIFLSPAHLGLAFLKSVLVTSTWLCAYFSIKHLPLSVASPLRSLSPVLTVAGALLVFHEVPSLRQWAGIFVVFLGYFGFAVLGREEGIHFQTNRWVLLLLFGTAIGGTSGLYDKFLLGRLGLPPTGLQFWFSAFNALLHGVLAAVIWWPKRSEKPFSFRVSAVLVGLFLLGADQLYFRALSDPDALVSVVSLMRRGSLVVSFVVGGLLFREKLLKKKAVPLGVLVTGLLLLLW